MYPSYRIINPKYINIAIEMVTPEDFRQMMIYYILPIARTCNVLAYYKDGSYAPVVDMEIEEALNSKFPLSNFN